MKDNDHKKKNLPLLLPLLEAVEIEQSNLFQQFLRLRKRVEALLDLLFPSGGDRDLAYLSIAQADRQYPNRSVAIGLTLFTFLAAWLVAAHHPLQQRARQDGGRIGHLLK